MSLPSLLYALRWLARDTFRQAAAGGLLWVLLAVTALSTLFCLSLGFSGDAPLGGDEPALFLPADVPPGVMSEDTDREDLRRRFGVETVRGSVSIAFGAVEVPMQRDRPHAVRYVQLLMAGWVADTAGVLLVLIWTAGFLPAFLEPASAAVLLAKPVPRWALLAGKYLGVVLLVFAQAVLFVGATWVALGVRSGVWDPAYLLCAPLLTIHFAAFFGFSAFLAVWARGTPACVIGTVLFWLMCWGLNFGRHLAVVSPDLSQGAGALTGLLEVGYWLMPKPADLNLILFDVLGGEHFFGRSVDAAALEQRGALDPGASILSSLLFAAAMLAVAALESRETDY